MLEDVVCTQIHVRKLQKSFLISADVLNRCSLIKQYKRNWICSNSAQKLLAQRKEFYLVTLQVGRFDLLRVEGLLLQCQMVRWVEIPLLLLLSVFLRKPSRIKAMKT